MRRFSLACAFVTMTAVSSGAALADTESVAPPPGVYAVASAIGFSAADNTVVRVYFARNPVVWTGIPPELARNFARGRELPTGIAMEPLPPPLVERLPVRNGYLYARIGQDVALIHKSTRIVIDVIESVFR